MAQRTFERLDAFLTKFLAAHPFTGKPIAGRDLFESFVPKTPFVLVYRVDTPSDTITVLALFHHAQDRTTFEPD